MHLFVAKGDDRGYCKLSKVDQKVGAKQGISLGKELIDLGCLVIILCKKNCTVFARARKKTLCTMQFGNRTFVL
jgi:hypothetical protein